MLWPAGRVCFLMVASNLPYTSPCSTPRPEADVHTWRTGADGRGLDRAGRSMPLYSPTSYSSALGARSCPAGRFHLDVASGAMQWSDGLFALHGYWRTEVVPTIELLLAHKHPEDRDQAAEIIAEVLSAGGDFCFYHRIIDSRQRVRRVLSTGHGTLDAAGNVTAIDGLMMDLTDTVRHETELAVQDAIAGVTASRSTIEQAKGILMGRLLISSAEAFALLVACSSRRNIKVAVLADNLVDLADGPQVREGLDGLIRSLQALAAAPRTGAVRAGDTPSVSDP